MSPEDPRHGTPAGAIAHWRDGEQACLRCTTASRTARKRRELDRLHGLPATTALGDAWDVLDRANGWWRQLSVATGLPSHRLIRYHQRGRDQIVRRSTRDRILAADRHYWTPVGIQRRLRALSALGWSMAEVSSMSGIHVDGLKRLRRREHPQFVRENVAQAVVAIFDELSMRPAPTGHSSRRTLVDARALGYAPPLAWDDIDTDVAPNLGAEDEDVDPVVVMRLLEGQRVPSTKAEKDAAMEQWVADGGTKAELCRWHGWKPGRYGTPLRVIEGGAA